MIRIFVGISSAIFGILGLHFTTSDLSLCAALGPENRYLSGQLGLDCEFLNYTTVTFSVFIIIGIILTVVGIAKQLKSKNELRQDHNS